MERKGEWVIVYEKFGDKRKSGEVLQWGVEDQRPQRGSLFLRGAGKITSSSGKFGEKTRNLNSCLQPYNESKQCKNGQV